MRGLFLLLITILICSCGEVSRPTGGEQPTIPDSSITIMGWNVEQFSAYEPYLKIASTVEAAGVDILMISESQSENGGDEAALSEELAASKWSMPYHAYAAYWDGLGVFSRYPIRSTELVAYGDGPRNIYRVVISLSENREITLYGAHLKSGSDQRSFTRRVAQSQALADYIRANHDLSKDEVVILGDMNTMGTEIGEPNEDFKTGSTLDRLCLKDDDDESNDFIPVNYTYLPETDTHHWPSLLDHIILSPVAMDRYIEGSVSVLETPWSGVHTYSDHRPVVVDLSIK